MLQNLTTQVPPPRYDVCGRRGPVPALRRVVVVGPRVAGTAPEGLGRAPAKKIVQGHRSRRRGRSGDEAALLLRRLAGPAARAAGEWRITRRLGARIFFDDVVGVTKYAPRNVIWLAL